MSINPYESPRPIQEIKSNESTYCQTVVTAPEIEGSSSRVAKEIERSSRRTLLFCIGAPALAFTLATSVAIRLNVIESISSRDAKNIVALSLMSFGTISLASFMKKSKEIRRSLAKLLIQRGENPYK